MWNVFSRVLRLRPFVVLVASLVILPISTAMASRAAGWPSSQPLAATAACGDVVINEVVFNEDSVYGDEWVELYVVNTLPVDTVLTVKDDDSGASDFVAEITLAEEIVADRYIVIHAEDEADSQESGIGTLNIFDAGDGYRDLANTNENLGLFVSGVACEEVYWESSAGQNSAAFSASDTFVFTGSGAVGSGESIARSPNGAGGTFVSGATPGLYNATGGQSIGRNNMDGTLAITLSWFQSRHIAEGVEFAWQTSTETGTAGFNLLAEAGDELIQLNSSLIPSPVIDSVIPTDYRYVVAAPAASVYLQEVSIEGVTTEYGPFTVDAEYGTHHASAPSAESQTGSYLYLPLTHR